jgi:hypothetical protein
MTVGCEFLFYRVMTPSGSWTALYGGLRQQVVVTRYKGATLGPSHFKTQYILGRTYTNTPQCFIFNAELSESTERCNIRAPTCTDVPQAIPKHF